MGTKIYQPRQNPEGQGEPAKQVGRPAREAGDCERKRKS